MKKQFAELPEWKFDMDEVSAGVYEVLGRDRAGRSVSAKGTNLDLLLEQCRREAMRISMESKSNK